jgi:DNA invertase Pin-like site-specific DNA recombinase
MIKYCQNNKGIDAIIVHKIDRFSRNNIDFYAYKAILKKEGVKLLSVSENIDENPSGEFIENILIAMAQFYSSNLATEVLKGMKEKFERGEWPLKAPVGYKNIRDESGKAIIVEDESKSYIIKRLFELYATNNYSLQELSLEAARHGLLSRTNKPLSPEAIKKILKNKFYIGIMQLWNKEVKGKHKPLIDESLFNQVQTILANRSNNHDKNQNRDYLLRGLLYCLKCNRRLTAETHLRGEYYRCQNNLYAKCDSRYIPIKVLEDKIERIFSLLKPSEELKQLIRLEIEEVKNNILAKQKDEVNILKKKIAEYKAKIDTLVDNLASKTITGEVYERYAQKYEQIIKVSKDRLAVLEKDYTSNFDFIDKCLILISTISKLYSRLSFRQRKQLAKAIFKAIWVKDKNIKYIQLNSPFDFLLKDNIKKIKGIKFEHYPPKTTKVEKFEHLINAIYSPNANVILDLVKSIRI